MHNAYSLLFETLSPKAIDGREVEPSNAGAPKEGIDLGQRNRGKLLTAKKRIIEESVTASGIDGCERGTTKK